MNAGKRRIRKTLQIIAAAAALFILLQIIPVPWKISYDDAWFADNGKPLIIAHRGGRVNWPENTVLAFSEAVKAGADVLEMDVQLTRDGILVTSHDNAYGERGISRTAFSPSLTDTSGDIITYSIDELGSFSFAADHVFHMREGFERMIPSDILDPRYEKIWDDFVSYSHGNTGAIGTLSDIRSAFNPNNCFEINNPHSPNRIPLARLEQDIFAGFKDADILFLIEIKQSGETGERASDELFRLAHKYGIADRILVQTFHNEIADYFRQTDRKGVRIGPGVSATTKIIVTMLAGLDFFMKTDFAALNLPAGRANEGESAPPLRLDRSFFIRKAHRHNLPVYYWTVNHPDDISKLTKIGADGIITDDPLLMIDLLNQKIFDGKPPARPE